MLREFLLLGGFEVLVLLGFSIVDKVWLLLLEIFWWFVWVLEIEGCMGEWYF